MKGHTETPWSIQPFAVDHKLRATCGIYDADHRPIAMAHPHDSQKRWEANARFITTACNHFEEMYEALKAIERLSAGWDDLGSTGPRHPLSWETVGRLALDIARSLLSRIEADHD